MTPKSDDEFKLAYIVTDYKTNGRVDWEGFELEAQKQGFSKEIASNFRDSLLKRGLDESKCWHVTWEGEVVVDDYLEEFGF